MVKLIDVHGAKGPVNWTEVKHSGVDGAYVKKSEGLTFDDDRYLENDAKARAAHIRIGAYHFARPDLHGPVEEARHFLHGQAQAGKPAVPLRWRQGDLPPALDFEQHARGRSQAWMTWWAQTFLAELRRNGHKYVTFYTYPSFWRSDMGAPATTFGGSLLWWASYGVQSPGGPAHWPVWLWQHSSSGLVPGVSGKVDLDAYAGDQAAFTNSFDPQPASAVKYAQPWPVFADGKQIGAGRLTDYLLVRRIRAALAAHGLRPPFTATSDGVPVARGRFWLPGAFTRAIAVRLHAGHDVVVNNTVTIKTRKV